MLISSAGSRLLGLAGVALTCVFAACGSSASTSLSPSSVPKCKVAVTPGQLAVDGAGGTGAMAVAAEAECAWTASAAANWISALTPSSGQGNGEVKFQVAANPAGTARQADISLNDTVAKVTQAGAPCRVQLAPERQTVAAAGGNGTITITTLSGCVWTVSSNASWLTASPSEGAGSGTVSFSATANTGAARVGNLSIGGQTFVVTQQAAGAPPPQCTYAVQPASTSIGAGGGALTVAVKTGPSCSWTATSTVSWLTVGGPGTGSGTGSLAIAVSANTGAARSGTVTIADQSFTVTQTAAGAPPPPPPACVYVLVPVSQSVVAAGGPVSVAVQTTTGCAWTATTATSWLKIGQASGTGNGTVDVVVANNNGEARTGTITIAGLTHTVNQASGCEVSIDPSSAAFSSSGGAGTPITVKTVAGCGWTATTTAEWIDVTSGASGTGNGEVAYTVEPNSGAARQGTISIATNTFTVTQAAPCSYSIDPTSATFDKDPATSDPVSVTAPAGCTWTAMSNDSWITVRSGAAGTGNGTVTFEITINDGTSTRVGTLTIAGHTFSVTQTAE